MVCKSQSPSREPEISPAPEGHSYMQNPLGIEAPTARTDGSQRLPSAPCRSGTFQSTPECHGSEALLVHLQGLFTIHPSEHPARNLIGLRNGLEGITMFHDLPGREPPDVPRRARAHHSSASRGNA